METQAAAAAAAAASKQQQQQQQQPVNFEDEKELSKAAEEIARPISAPPVMELSTNTLFAFRTEYAHFFSDIRCQEHYEGFYKSHDDPSKLPVPLAGPFDLEMRQNRAQIEEVMGNIRAESMIEQLLDGGTESPPKKFCRSPPFELDGFHERRPQPLRCEWGLRHELAV